MEVFGLALGIVAVALSVVAVVSGVKRRKNEYNIRKEVKSLYVPLICGTCGGNLKEVDSGSEGARKFECPNCPSATLLIHARNNPLFYLRTLEEKRI